jgi:hypothetical protein
MLLVFFDVQSFNVRSFLMFSLSRFGPIRGSVFQHSVFRRSVPFDVQPFDVWSHSRFGLSMFGPFRHSVFRGSVFRRSVFRGSVFRDSVIRGSVTVSFQRMLDCILAGLNFSFRYLDGITVASSSYQDHLGHLRLLFQWLQQRGLAINLEKCVFATASVEFLGHEISAAGVKSLCGHVEAILDHPQPFNFKQLQAFLGGVNFYHHFLPGAAGLVRPFKDALCSGTLIRSEFRGHLTWQTPSLRPNFFLNNVPKF